MSEPRPNLLFLMTDHQRADSLGMVQAGVEVAPNLNRLADDAADFSRAYTTCPLCVPARTALATGTYPTSTGVVFNDWRGDTAGDHTPLHECLARAGYQVAHVGVHHVRVRHGLRERVAFAQWVDNADYARMLERQGVDEPPDLEAFRRTVVENQRGRPTAVRYSNTRTAVWPHAAEHFKDFFFCRQAVGFLTGERSGPFALFVCLWAPHPPLRVPEPYASRFDPQRLELPPNVGRPAEGEPPGRRRGIAAQLAEGVGTEEWRRVWAAHLGLVSLADEAIGRILHALERAGRGDDTLVVFTADHGDHLGQHRMYQKMEMYEPAIRVPLLIRAPGGRGASFDVPVSHLDVVPTVLDLLDLDRPEGLDGVSLAASVVGEVPPPRRTVFAQYSGNPTVGDIRRAAITARHKYVYDPADSPELYDLEADPLETHNRAEDEACRDILQKLHARAATWARDHDDWAFPQRDGQA
ncbi:MAG: sulfatase-like hydrolase/transferase [Candidatus Brocadiia bacterium]